MASVKRDLTSNIKVSWSRVASPSAVDCHTLVLALVCLLTVLNLKCSWGRRLKFHYFGLHHKHYYNTSEMVIEKHKPAIFSLQPRNQDPRFDILEGYIVTISNHYSLRTGRFRLDKDR